jgi:hypothetical protein
LTNTGYFNTKFVSLQYKNKINTKQSSVEKYAGKSLIFLKIFFEENFLLLFSGWAQLGPCGWDGPG